MPSKSVDPDLKVGGPATADNAWVSDFLHFCTENRLPADFISTHHYPTDSFGKPGDDTVTQLSQSQRSVLRDAGARCPQAGWRFAGLLYGVVHVLQSARPHA